MKPQKSLSIKESNRVEELADQLKDISPFDINAEEVEPLWFSHPKLPEVFCKIGIAKDGKRILTTWLTMTTEHDSAVMLTFRRATKKEEEYYRSRLSNA